MELVALAKRAGILLLLLAVAGCVTAPRPDVLVIGVEPLPGGTLEQRVRVDLRVQNPSPQQLSIAGVSLRLLLDDEPLARGVSDRHFTVPPLGEATTSIVTSTTLFDLMRQVYRAQTGTTLKYRLEGKLFLDEPPGRSLSFESEGILAPPPEEE